MSEYDDTPHEDVILSELSSDVAAFEQAKTDFEKARAMYEVARERLIATKKLAVDTTSPGAVAGWLHDRPGIRYFGVSIGDGILGVLADRCYQMGEEYMDEKEGMPDWYEPEMTLTDIVKMLKQGGFEFSSATPAREVNAALINLKGVWKSVSGYSHEDHESMEKVGHMKAVASQLAKDLDDELMDS